MNQDEIFDSLTRNAFDFLERGIEEFDKAPKYSVIHFCAAVEMLLKARLMKEHWSLIVSKPEQANLAKFIAGDFMSVTLEDSRARLRDVAGEDIGDDAHGSFRAMANHRNKMVHFFHPDLDTDDKAKAQIVAEHCRAWFHLHRLLNRWSEYFREFRSEIARANRSMKGHRKYLGAKFAALKAELDAARKAGKKPRTCSACALKAAVPEEIDDRISSLRCLVCDHIETQVHIDCPHCSESIVIANEGFASCVHCGRKIEPEHVFDALEDHDAAHMAARDGDDGWQPANCGNCQSYHTVVRRDDHYFCTSCFEVSEQVEQCEWCSDFSTGDMENSLWDGCEHCDGKAGWEKDE
ncbi:hypothetical protein [Aquimonas voraii]|uniref:Uncharacterized protein n=1 Tax=Aquimonas voraii TaxID=265719 RepID=A0A1G6T4H1_9GAMM|nr:hypothetical protein [Aquimonas voraii]SDD23436.1 hypothetical protein SAMN04488509_101853 [Aquimonas voraii]